MASDSDPGSISTTPDLSDLRSLLGVPPGGPRALWHNGEMDPDRPEWADRCGIGPMAGGGGFWTNRVRNARRKSWDQGQDKLSGDPVLLILQRPLVLLMALLRG